MGKRFPESARRFIEEHPSPKSTDETLYGGRDSLYAVGDTDNDGEMNVTNLRTGKTEDMNAIEFTGWLGNKSKDRQSLRIGATEEVKNRGAEIAKAHRRSPKETFEMQSKQAQETDVAVTADRVTNDTLQYNLAPNRFDFENFDTKGGDAKDVFDL